MVDPTSIPPLILTGQCKWFRDRIGYGFITVVEPGPHLNKEIFVHHSGIRPRNCTFKSLTKGEYVHFSIEVGNNGADQACNVTGIYGGTLMCDNSFHSRQSDHVQPPHVIEDDV